MSQTLKALKVRFLSGPCSAVAPDFLTIYFLVYNFHIRALWKTRPSLFNLTMTLDVNTIEKILMDQ